MPVKGLLVFIADDTLVPPFFVRVKGACVLAAEHTKDGIQNNRSSVSAFFLDVKSSHEFRTSR